MNQAYKVTYKTVADYNSTRLTSESIITGKEFRRLKRAGKLV